MPASLSFLHRLRAMFSSSAAGAPVQRCPYDPECVALANNLVENAAAREKAALANAAYGADPPPGWHDATEEDLKSLGLIDEDGENLTRMPGSDFKARVMKDDDGNFTIAFKGTTPTSTDDWAANIGQGTGLKTTYYTRAQLIGDQAVNAQPGKVSFVGHSLGGGMASAASRASGAPATTFNAAGLHQNTVKSPVPGEIKAYYVKGDLLSGLQDNVPKMPTAAGERMPLTPAQSVTRGDVAAGVVGGAVTGPVAGVGAGVAARGVRLHSMDSVEASLVRQAHRIRAEQVNKGCPT